MSDFDLASGEGLIDTIPVSDSRTLRQGKAPLNARQRRFLRAQEASRDSVLADRLEATLVDAEQGGLRRSWNNFWRADAIMREASQEHGAFSVASREAADLEMAALNAVSVMSEERREVFTGLLVRSREGTQSVLDRMQALTRTLGHAHAEATLAHDVVAVIQGMDERLQQEVLGQTAQALQQSGELVQTKARGFGGMLSAVRQGKFGVRDLIAGYKGEFYNATIGGVTHMLDARQRQAYILAKARGQEVRMERHIGDNVKETYGGMA
ncbi:MAG TPA: hypothetical protein PKL83_07175, partial [bacterium]|nr:hypothetical protein [bacterium]